MIRQWTNTGKIAAEMLEDAGLNDDRHFTRFKRWAEAGVIRLGHFPYYSVKATRVDIDDCGIICKPDDFVSVRKVFVCENGRLIECGYKGEAPEALFDPDGCCSLYRKTPYQGHPEAGRHGRIGGNIPRVPADVVVGETDTHFFLTIGDPRRFDFAVVEYNGFHYTDDGHLKVLTSCEFAIKSFISLKLAQHNRSRDKSTTPWQEVKDLRSMMKQDMNEAYGDINLTPMPVLKEWVLEEYGINFRAPDVRINNS